VYILITCPDESIRNERSDADAICNNTGNLPAKNMKNNSPGIVGGERRVFVLAEKQLRYIFQRPVDVDLTNVISKVDLANFIVCFLPVTSPWVGER
jgi:hypothetical protein